GQPALARRGLPVGLAVFGRCLAPALAAAALERLAQRLLSARLGGGGGVALPKLGSPCPSRPPDAHGAAPAARDAGPPGARARQTGDPRLAEPAGGALARARTAATSPTHPVREPPGRRARPEHRRDGGSLPHAAVRADERPSDAAPARPLPFPHSRVAVLLGHPGARADRRATQLGPLQVGGAVRGRRGPCLHLEGNVRLPLPAGHRAAAREHRAGREDHVLRRRRGRALADDRPVRYLADRAFTATEPLCPPGNERPRPQLTACLPSVRTPKRSMSSPENAHNTSQKVRTGPCAAGYAT